MHAHLINLQKNLKYIRTLVLVTGKLVSIRCIVVFVSVSCQTLLFVQLHWSCMLPSGGHKWQGSVRCWRKMVQPFDASLCKRGFDYARRHHHRCHKLLFTSHKYVDDAKERHQDYCQRSCRCNEDQKNHSLHRAWILRTLSRCWLESKRPQHVVLVPCLCSFVRLIWGCLCNLLSGFDGQKRRIICM